MEREEQERKARSQRAAEARREELAKSRGEDPVKAALERLKARKSGELNETVQAKTITSAKGELLPDNTDLMAQRQARRLARQQAQSQKEQNQAAEASNAVLNSTFNNAEAAAGKTPAFEEKPTTLDPKKAAVAAAIARAKAKKAAQTQQKLDESQE